jgi:glycosyltransferase involved in cell wall biosynthesis
MYESGLGMQFRKTTGALRARGVRIDIADAEPATTAPDIIHLFDAPDHHTALRSLMRARAAAKLGTKPVPIVSNPIYCNSDRFYDEGLPEADPPTGEGAELEQMLRDTRRHAERAAQRVLFRNAAVLIAMSESEAELLVRDFGVERERICLATDGIAPEFANATPDAFTNKYGIREFVLCAARIEIRKNQWGLIRALRDEPITLVFAGETLAQDYRARCERAAEGGHARVVFLPSLGTAMLASAYAAARAHALASWADCAPFTPLEAAVAGCGIAMSRESGARDYFKDTAQYFDPARLDEIKSAVGAAMETRTSDTLRERLAQECTWERCAEQTCEAYQRAQQLGNPDSDAGYRDDVEAALDAMSEYAQLQEKARAQLWREKVLLAQERDAYANGRMMKALKRLQTSNK